MKEKPSSGHQSFLSWFEAICEHSVLQPCSLAPGMYLHARQLCHIFQQLASTACSSLQFNIENTCSAGSEALLLLRTFFVMDVEKQKGYSTHLLHCQSDSNNQE